MTLAWMAERIHLCTIAPKHSPFAACRAAWEETLPPMQTRTPSRGKDMLRRVDTVRDTRLGRATQAT